MIKLYSDINDLFLEAYRYPKNFANFILQYTNKYDTETKKGINANDFLEKFISELELLIKNEADLFFQDENTFSNGLQDVNAYIKTFETLIVESQIKERFYPQKDDTISIKTIKIFKRKLQQIIWIGVKAENKFRKYTKREIKDLHYKKHRLQKQELAEYVFVNCFLKKIGKTYNKTLSNRQSLLISLAEIELKISSKLLINAELNISELKDSIYAIISDIEKFKNETQFEIDLLENELTDEFQNLQLKYGTFEFPSRKTDPSKLFSQREKRIRNLTDIFNSHKLNLQSLVSYFGFRLNIQTIFTKSNKGFTHTIRDIKKNLNENVNIQLAGIEKDIMEWLDENQMKTDFDTTHLSNKILNSQIPKLENSIIKIDLSVLIEKLENYIGDLIHELNTFVYIPLTGEFNKPLKSKKINQVNTKVVLQGNYEKSILIKFAIEKRSLISSVQKILQKINEISEVMEFSLDYIKYNEKSQQNTLDFIEGIKRASNRTNEFAQFVQEIEKGILSELETIRTDFIKSLSLVIEPQTITQLIKKQVRTNKINRVKVSLIHLAKFNRKKALQTKERIQKVYYLLKEKYLNLQILFEIDSSKHSLSNDLRNFLSETKQTINSLPLMYQKLFKSVALTNNKFYIPRNEVNQQLKDAYTEWHKKKFASICITGESGNGITTVFNFFEKEREDNIPLHRVMLNKQITGENELIDFLKSIFTNFSFSTISELKQKIETDTSKQIIIVENIHNLFARYNDGFTNINSFLSLVLSTHKNIFWMCSVKLYPLKYLDYTVDINSYFAYTIELPPMNQKQITQIIFDRHLPSGYKIEYLQQEGQRHNRKFKRSSKKVQQKILEQDFFDKLYEQTQGNIKLSLLFWQISIVKIENDTFYFKIKNDIDYSFIGALHINVIKILHNILIHEGLNVDEYSKIFKCSISQSRTQLDVLKNKAILINREEEYLINPLLYRQVVNYLKSIKFIH